MDKTDYAYRGNTILSKCCTNKDCEVESKYMAYEKMKANQKRKQEQEWKKRKEKLRKEVGAKPKQSVDPLQKVINKIAVTLDKDEPCLARPLDRNNRYEGGHVIPVSRYKSLRYNLWNIHKQGSISNRSLMDDQLMLEGVERRYGKEKREYLEGLHKEYPTLKLSKVELLEALKIARQILRELDSGKKLTRDEINKRLNIYKL